MNRTAEVTAVSRSARHEFSKADVGAITLLEGLGVEGDTHAGVTVQHRSRVRADPTQPNLRQVHLIHAELHDELRAQAFDVAPGQLGENVTTRSVDLLDLPRGTLLHLGPVAVVEITGLRNPCRQINDFRAGLLGAVLGRDDAGRVVRRAGVMAVVRAGGPVRRGDGIVVARPALPHLSLEPV